MVAGRLSFDLTSPIFTKIVVDGADWHLQSFENILYEPVDDFLALYCGGGAINGVLRAEGDVQLGGVVLLLDLVVVEDLVGLERAVAVLAE